MYLAREIYLTPRYAALSNDTASGWPIARVTFFAPTANSATAYIEGDDGTDVPIPKGFKFTITTTDLTEIRFKGTSGDKLFVVGDIGR